MTDGQIEWNAGAPIQQILRHWKALLAWSAIGGVIALVVAIKEVPVYGSVAVLQLPLPSADPTGILRLGKDQQSPGSTLEGVIQSKTVKDRLGESLKLKQDEFTLGTSTDDSNGQLKITSTHKSKAKSLEIVQDVIDQLQRRRQEMNEDLANRRATLLKKAVHEREDRLSQAEKRLVEFQGGMKTSPDPTTPYLSVKTQSDLKAAEQEFNSLDQEISYKRQQYAKTAQMAGRLPTTLPVDEERRRVNEIEFQLKTLRVDYNEGHPLVVQAKERLKVAQQALQTETSKQIQALNLGLPQDLIDLEARKRVVGWQRDALRELVKSAPQEAATLSSLQAEVTVQAELLKQAKGQFEQALLSGEVDNLSWSILDAPYTMKEPVNKSYSRSVILGGFGGFMVGLAAVIIRLTRKGKKRATA